MRFVAVLVVIVLISLASPPVRTFRVDAVDKDHPDTTNSLGTSSVDDSHTTKTESETQDPRPTQTIESSSSEKADGQKSVTEPVFIQPPEIFHTGVYSFVASSGAQSAAIVDGISPYAFLNGAKRIDKEDKTDEVVEQDRVSAVADEQTTPTSAAVSNSDRKTPSPISSVTVTPPNTLTFTVTPTPTVTTSATPTPTPKPTRTATPTEEPTVVPSSTPSSTPTSTPSECPGDTQAAASSATPVTAAKPKKLSFGLTGEIDIENPRFYRGSFIYDQASNAIVAGTLPTPNTQTATRPIAADARTGSLGPATYNTVSGNLGFPRVGRAMYYNPGIMERVLAFRLSVGHVRVCTECVGHVALLGREDLNRKVWLEWENGEVDGPFLTIDVAAAHHVAMLLQRNWVVDIDWQTANRIGMNRPLPVTVWDRPPTRSATTEECTRREAVSSDVRVE